jgi:ribose transport system substrate-binding protein
MELNARQNGLLRKIAAKGTATAEELRQLITAGRETLRKELLHLEKLGVIERSYGKIRFIDSERNRALLQDIGLLTRTQRHERIQKLLAEHHELRISFLAAKLNVSTLTVRKDLDELERQGLLIRKHGAAALLSGTAALLSGTAAAKDADALREFDQRAEVLGRHSLLHVNPGDRIFLGPGTISSYIAAMVPLHANIPITTNSLDIVRILMDRQYTSPIQMVPGTIAITTGNIAVGNARSFFAAASIDKAFFSVASYSNHAFFMDRPEDVATASEVSEYVKKIYLVLDSSTIDKRGPYRFPHDGLMEKIQEILVDDGISRAEANLVFAKRDPVVIYGPDFAFRNLRRRKYRIGFIVDGDRNYFIQAVYNSLLESVARYSSVALLIRESEGDYQSTIRNFDLLLRENIDLVIDFSLCMDSMLYVSEKCRIHGVKLIGVDLRLPGSVYFGADNALAGTMAGERAADYITTHWNGQLQRIIVLGRHGMDPITNLRVMSAVDRIRAHVHLGCAEPETIEWGVPGRNPTQDLIDRLRTLPRDDRVLFIAFNLRHMMAAHEIIARHRGAENTIMVGQNYNRQIEELMNDPASPIIGCVHYNPEEYGERIMQLAMRMLGDQTVEALNYTTHTWIPKGAG